MFVEVTEVLHCRVIAVVASALGKAVVQALAAACLGPAVVEGVRINAKKPNKRVQLPYSILQRSSSEAPLVEGDEVEDSLCGAVRVRADEEAVGAVDGKRKMCHMTIHVLFFLSRKMIS